jgi:hypothetical protein
LARDTETYTSGDFTWLDSLSDNVIEATRSVEGANAVDAQFLDDLQTLDRLAETTDLQPSFRAYARIMLFTVRFDLSWLVVTGAI